MEKIDGEDTISGVNILDSQEHVPNYLIDVLDMGTDQSVHFLKTRGSRKM